MQVFSNGANGSMPGNGADRTTPSDDTTLIMGAGPEGSAPPTC